MKAPTIKFIFDRHHRATKVSKGSIEIRVSYNGKLKYMGTGISVYPRHWEEKTQRVRGDGAALEYNSPMTARPSPATPSTLPPNTPTSRSHSTTSSVSSTW